MSTASLRTTPPSTVRRAAVLIPCLNEAQAVSQVVRDAARYLPNAQIYVYDNGSTDDSAELARRAGARVRCEAMQGKGNVVRRMFRDIDADAYVLVDGDNTYDLSTCAELVAKLHAERLDMITVCRVASEPGVFPRGHELGNRAFTAIVNFFFRGSANDVLSGYRVLSRAFVKSFPAISMGFEIETELAVHALELGLPTAEATAAYRKRPDMTRSKLRGGRDGLRILRMVAHLLRTERPLLSFTSVAATVALLAVVLMIPVFAEYEETGLVRRFPTAILSTGLMLAALLSAACGLVLDAVASSKRQMKRLFYLAQTVSPRLTHDSENSADARVSARDPRQAEHESPHRQHA